MSINHPACPKRLYDLHGIPEDRCPECGSVFELASLHTAAAKADQLQIRKSNQIIVHCIAVLVCCMFDYNGFAQSGSPAVVIVCSLLWMIYGTVLLVSLIQVSRLQAINFKQSPALAIYFVGVFGLLKAGPPTTILVAVIILSFSWITIIFYWTPLAPVGNSLDQAFRRSVELRTRVAQVFIGLSTLSVLAVYIW